MVFVLAYKIQNIANNCSNHFFFLQMLTIFYKVKPLIQYLQFFPWAKNTLYNFKSQLLLDMQKKMGNVKFSGRNSGFGALGSDLTGDTKHVTQASLSWG